MPQDRNALIWVDMEMTGLNPDTDKVLEVAIVVTDAQLNTIAQAPVLVLHHPNAVLDGMDAWNKKTHGQSGLIDRVRASTLTATDLENQMLAFLREHVPAQASPMCGNSVCQDRRFMARHLPKLEEYFHYRNLDVSTLKELAKRWRPDVLAGVVKKGRHEALADIEESIEELKHYRASFLQASVPS
jgi:oligoribonuclease